MREILILSFLFMSFVLVARAEEVPINKPARIHVEITAVISSGEVTPVNGVTSAGQPDEQALRVFADSGYVAVIDMRGINENRGLEDEQASVEATGMEYIAFPITSGDEISFDSARKLDGLLGDLDGPVLIHCGSGNRVGAVLALRHSLSGADNEESLEHGRDAGMTSLEAAVRERLNEK